MCYLLFLFQNHYSNTDVALVVFDMSEERTLFSANIWKAELFNHLPTNVPTLLVGNKVCTYATCMCMSDTCSYIDELCSEVK